MWDSIPRTMCCSVLCVHVCMTVRAHAMGFEIKTELKTNTNQGYTIRYYRAKLLHNELIGHMNVT